MKWRAFLPVVVLPLCLCCGCRSGGGDGPSYETVPADPQRDTERARRCNERAAAALKTGDLETAERELKSALVADTQFGPAHNNLGVVYFRQRKLYMAAWEFEYAAKLMPNKAEPLNGLGLVYEAVGRAEEAAKKYEAALALDPDSVQITANLARLCVTTRRKDARTRALLEVVAQRDTRTDWSEWARMQLAIFGEPEPSAPPPAADAPLPQ